MSCPVASVRVVSRRVVSCQVASALLASCFVHLLASCHVFPSRRVMRSPLVSCHVASCHVMSRPVRSSYLACFVGSSALATHRKLRLSLTCLHSAFGFVRSLFLYILFLIGLLSDRSSLDFSQESYTSLKLKKAVSTNPERDFRSEILPCETQTWCWDSKCSHS